VTPPGPGRVLLGEVLGIVDQQIGPLTEAGVLEIVAAQGQVTATGEPPVMGFMVGGVHQGRPVDLESVPEREGGMVEIARGH